MPLMTKPVSPTRASVHVVQDPRPGDALTVPAGCRLALRFRRRGLGLSRWEVVDRPGHLLPLEEGPHGFLFLVFEADDAGGPQPLRLVRRRIDRTEPGETRDLTVRVS
jgi:hypothetical protein